MAAEVLFLDEGEVIISNIVVYDDKIEEGTTNTGSLKALCSIGDCKKISIKQCKMCNADICCQHTRAYKSVKY